MRSNYNDCLNRLLKDEGGYTNDPADSGGPTNYGITIFDVRKYINKNATSQDVRDLSLDQAKNIYKSKYWDSLGCDTLSSGVDYTCFDYGVNSGLARPRAALNRFKDKIGAELINAINDERVAFLHAISGGKNAKFLRGWLARVSRVRQHSLDLAKTNNSTGPLVATAGTGAVVAAVQHFNFQPYMLVVGVAAAVVVGFLIHYILNRGKK